VDSATSTNPWGLESQKMSASGLAVEGWPGGRPSTAFSFRPFTAGLFATKRGRGCAQGFCDSLSVSDDYDPEELVFLRQAPDRPCFPSQLTHLELENLTRSFLPHVVSKPPPALDTQQDVGEPSRDRFRTSPAERARLEAFFISEGRIPSRATVDILLASLGPAWSKSRILKWFDNRRGGPPPPHRLNPFRKTKLCLLKAERAILEGFYTTNAVPNAADLGSLQMQLSLIRGKWTRRRVVQWFTNRRKTQKRNIC